MNKRLEDKEQIKSWLETQPRDVISVFAARAALRAVPRLNGLVNFKAGLLFYEPENLSAEQVILSILWSCATALSAGTWPSSGTKMTNAPSQALEARLEKTNDFIGSLINSAIYAGVAATSNPSKTDPASPESFGAAAAIYVADHPDILAEYSNDISYIENGNSAQDLAVTSLWAATPDDDHTSYLAEFIKEWHELREYLLAINHDWDIWTKWYEDRLWGIERGWFRLPFVEEVEIGKSANDGYYGRVTLPTKYYKDPAKANAAIKEIIEDYGKRHRSASNEFDVQNIVNATPLAEEIHLGEDGKFTVDFLPVRDLFANNLKRIDDAISQAISANAFNVTSPEIQFIKGILNKHADDPQRMHDDCRFARESINDLIEKEIIPDDFAVNRLQNALNQAMMDIRAYEPAVQNVHETRLRLEVDDTVELDYESIQTSNNKIKNIQSERLETEIGEDIATLIGGPRLAAGYRLLSRFSRMYLEIQNAATAHTLTDVTSVTLIKAIPHLEVILQYLRLSFKL